MQNKYTREDLVDKYGFQEISDEQGTDFEYVTNPDKWAESDYFLARKVSINLYEVDLLTTDGTLISGGIETNILNRDILNKGE